MSESYFNTIDTGALCRGGGNGPDHPSQIEGMSYVKDGESLLDVGCGSATSLEALLKHFPDKKVDYTGVDKVPRHVEWCSQNFPAQKFQVEEGTKMSFPDNSFDVVWSRHVVDHMPSLEMALDEHTRIARKRVICILWFSWTTTNEHLIKKVEMGGKQYEDDYLNCYSLAATFRYLETKKPEWDYKVIIGVGFPHSRQDSLIILERTDK